jgi:hypothetical protein
MGQHQQQHAARAGKLEEDEEESAPLQSQGSAAGTAAAGASLGAAPLTSEFMTPAEARALAHEFTRQEQEAAASRPVALHGHPHPPSAAQAAADRDAAVAVAKKAYGNDGKDNAGIALDISAALGSVSLGPAPLSAPAAVPVLGRIGAGTSSAGVGSGLGAKKLGASRLGASKLGATPISSVAAAKPVVSFDDFDAEAATPAPAPAPAPVVVPAPVMAPKVAPAAIAASSTASGSGAFTKYAKAKAISSDTFFASETDDATREAAARLHSMTGARAISSDMLYGSGGGRDAYDGGDSSAYGGAGSDRYAVRLGSAGEGVSEFVEQIGKAAVADLAKVGDALKEKGAKLKEGMGAFLDVLRR